MLRSVSDTAAKTRIDELLAGLNPPQREAVTHGEGPLPVSYTHLTLPTTPYV